MMTASCGDESAQAAARRYVNRFAGQGWADDESHLLDLLVLVERTMRSDHEASRAASWQRLRQAILDGLSAASRDRGVC